LSGLVPTCRSKVKIDGKCFNPDYFETLKAGKLVSTGLYIDEGRGRHVERAA